jgi:hypothetical protein
VPLQAPQDHTSLEQLSQTQNGAWRQQQCQPAMTQSVSLSLPLSYDLVKVFILLVSGLHYIKWDK